MMTKKGPIPRPPGRGAITDRVSSSFLLPFDSNSQQQQQHIFPADAAAAAQVFKKKERERDKKYL